MTLLTANETLASIVWELLKKQILFWDTLTGIRIQNMGSNCSKLGTLFLASTFKKDINILKQIQKNAIKGGRGQAVRKQSPVRND